MILPSNLKVSLHILPSGGYLKAMIAMIDDDSDVKKPEATRNHTQDLPFISIDEVVINHALSTWSY